MRFLRGSNGINPSFLPVPDLNPSGKNRLLPRVCLVDDRRPLRTRVFRIKHDGLTQSIDSIANLHLNGKIRLLLLELANFLTRGFECCYRTIRTDNNRLLLR